MDYQTRVSIVRNYELPKEITDFVKKHWPLTSYNTWYSENWVLKTK